MLPSQVCLAHSGDMLHRDGRRSALVAYKNIADYKRGTNFQAWLLTIARYQLMAETTRIRRVSDYHAKYVPEALAKPNQRLLEDGGDEDSRLEHLADCLGKLPASAIEVLRRRYEHGESSDEIANAIDRSAGAIRKQLCLLGQQLHQCVSLKMASELGHDA